MRFPIRQMACRALRFVAVAADAAANRIYPVRNPLLLDLAGDVCAACQFDHGSEPCEPRIHLNAKHGQHICAYEDWRQCGWPGHRRQQ
jgi:hypothetical protein